MKVPVRHIDDAAHRRLIAAAVNKIQELQEFTPTIVGTSAAGAGTYTKQQGYYQRIGHLIFVKGYLTWTAHTGTGNMDVGGLPVTSDDLTDSHSPVILNVDSIGLTANKVAQGYVVPDSNLVTLIQVPTGGGAIAAIPIDPAGTVIFSGWYTEKGS